MKVDLTQPLTQIDGSPLLENDKPVLARTVCARALVGDLEEDKGKPESKITRFRLAEKIMEAQGSSDIDLEDLDVIEKRIEQGFTTTVFVRIKRIFDQARSKASNEQEA